MDVSFLSVCQYQFLVPTSNLVSYIARNYLHMSLPAANPLNLKNSAAIWVCVMKLVVFESHLNNTLQLLKLGILQKLGNHLSLCYLLQNSFVSSYLFASGKELTCQYRRYKRRGFHPWLGRSLKEKIATYSNILAGRIPWTEEHGGLQSIATPFCCKESDMTEHLRMHIYWWLSQ